MIEAIRHYKAKRATPFSFIAHLWNRCGVQQEIFTQGYGMGVPPRLRHALGAAPLSKTKPHQDANAGPEHEPIYLDSPVKPRATATWLDRLAAPGQDPAEARALVTRAVAGLPQRQREIVRRYFWDGRSMYQIADELGLTYQRVPPRGGNGFVQT